MTESPAPTNWQHRLESRFKANWNPAAGSVLALAFLLRLWKASGTFLNLDEAMHFLAANKLTLADAYQTSLTLAHPPLLILFLHEWSKLGRSELFLRLPSVIVGTIFCWIFFRWLTRLLGPTVGWIGFILVGLLPVFIELSAEVRQYPLLLCFMMAAAYMLELSLAENSVRKMVRLLHLSLPRHADAFLGDPVRGRGGGVFAVATGKRPPVAADCCHLDRRAGSGAWALRLSLTTSRFPS